MKSSYSIIGGMAGSSMDGLDLAHVTFAKEQDEWTFEIGKATTIPYDPALFEKLKSSPSIDLEKQQELDLDFGLWIAERINEFKSDINKVDLLGIHGHTVIHKPEKGISWQLGEGSTIAKSTGIPTVTDFRTQDVKLGGQGAPLVPLGDFLLFQEYDACLNLGGIANISLKEDRTAWDICPCNQVLNFFAEKLGKPFDDGGNMARMGKLDRVFYSKISRLPYFAQSPPKSLPNHFISKEILDSVNPSDGLKTYSQIIAEQISSNLQTFRPGKILVTGGGVLNHFLIDLIKEGLSSWEVVIPEKDLILFKESLVFAFLALRKFRNEINVLSSVTGASKDSSSGVIHLP